jgi:chromosome segregation ATPase
VQELQRLRTLCKPASAERELFDLLLGWRNGPRIQQLEEQLAIEQDRLRKLVLLHAGEKAEWLSERGELEHQIAAGEQELHHLDQDLKSTTEDMQQRLQRLASENKTLSADVREMQRENQAFAAQAQKAQQERDKFAAELQTLRKYSAQLEQENIVLKRPRSGS